MTDEKTTENQMDRRSVLKKTATATAGAGALAGFATSSASASHNYRADGIDGYVYVYDSCGKYDIDKVSNNECGVKLDECYYNGEKYLYIDWSNSYWYNGWVKRESLDDFC